MKRTFASIALLVLLSIAGMAQTAGAPASQPTNPLATATGTKVAVIDMQGAIQGSNEGQRDLEALAKKFEPRRLELQRVNTEVEDLKKQLNTQGDKLNEDARATLVKQIESKQKSLDRSMQDAREDFQNQQGEIMQRIVPKLGQVLVKYAGENGFSVILDTSQTWPQGPVVWWGESVDVTKPVVDAYNAQSNVPAPASGAAPAVKPGPVKPAGTATNKPAGTSTKPADQPK